MLPMEILDEGSHDLTFLSGRRLNVENVGTNAAERLCIFHNLRNVKSLKNGIQLTKRIPAWSKWSYDGINSSIHYSACYIHK